MTAFKIIKLYELAIFFKTLYQDVAWCTRSCDFGAVSLSITFLTKIKKTVFLLDKQTKVLKQQQ